MKRRVIAFSFFLCFAAGLCFARTDRYHDITNQKIFSGLGTIVFRFQLLKDVAADPHNHVLLLGSSADSTESLKIQIVQDKLIVHRRFRRCVLAAFVYAYNFRPGEWHDFKVTWNGESSKFFVDGQEVKQLGLFSSQDLPKLVPCIRLGIENNFKIEGFRSTAASDIRIDPADREFVKTVVCTDLKQLLQESPQEEYRGIALRNFPDSESRAKIKAYIDLLPDGFAGAVRNIVFVEDARFLKGGEGGFADSISGSLVLKGSLYQQPTVFFHEAAHLYDTKLKINFGVPDEKSEWAAISGARCYFKGANMKEYYDDFRKTGVENAFLAPQGGQCASEDMAIWVGTVYDYYLKGQSFADKLRPGNLGYSSKNIRKLDFILKKGFIRQDVYDRVTRG